MSNIKKFINGEWVILASGKATGVSTTNPKFLLDGELVTSIDTALERITDTVNMHSKNISWLAAHGGGGSGGGTTPVDASIEVEGVNNNILIWNNTTAYFRFKINSSKSNLKWVTSIELDNQSIFTDSSSASNTWITIAINNINKYSINSSHTIHIKAYDSSYDVISYDLTVQLSLVTLSTSASYSISIENINTTNLTFTYGSKILGNYILKIGRDSSFSNSIDYDIVVNSTSLLKYYVPFGDIIPTASAGNNYQLYAKFIKADNLDITSSVISTQVGVISSSSIVILSSTLSSSIDTPTNVYKNGTMQILFTAYLLNGNLFNYSIISYDSSNTSYVLVDNKIGTFGQAITTPVGLINNDFFVVNNNYNIRIIVTQENSTLSGTLNFYTSIKASLNGLLPNIKTDNLIANLFCYGYQNNNSIKWSSLNTNFNYNGTNHNVSLDCNIININNLSGIQNDKVRLLGESYGLIDSYKFDNYTRPFTIFKNTAGNNSYLIDGNFTISIAYKADYHPDDNRVIFFIGNLNSDGSLGKGIKINVHDLLFKATTDNTNAVSLAVKLLDSMFNLIDIVYGDTYISDTISTRKYIKIYLNGVLLGIELVDASIIASFGDFSSMYFACALSLDTPQQYSDVSIYDFKLYNTNLNAFEIICNYLNNKAKSNLDINGLPDYITLELDIKRNLISRGENNTQPTSILWNSVDNVFSNNLITGGTINASLMENTYIPILYLDMSSAGWTWELFIDSSVGANTLPAVSNVSALYYDPSSGRTSPDRYDNMTIEEQGTTTRNYRIKNLNITNNNALWWVKKEWFPESTYTLKADIVDSAHANNASIGKFINNSGLLEDTPPMTYYKSDDQFKTIREAYPDLSIKHTLEGFPVMIIVNFKPEIGSLNTSDIRSLGIYSFNLGRDSYHNLGFKILKVLNPANETLTSLVPPCLVKTPESSTEEIDYFADAWEIKDTWNCKIDQSTDVGYNGNFWQYDDSIIMLQFENKYSYDGGNLHDSMRYLMEVIAKLPYKAGDNTITKYKAYKYINGDYLILNTDIISEISYALSELSKVLNLNNAYAYYIIGMAFGLVDNMGKNMNIRNWNKSSKWFTSFYDMDTANALDNAGQETISEDAYTSVFLNSETPSEGIKEYVGTYTDENNKITTCGYGVYSNKLWGIIDNPDVQYLLGNTNRYSIYTLKWETLRNVLTSADDFIETYFKALTSGCGELILNQDFDIKYVGTPQLNFMHGNRVNYVKLWLTKRIAFLDSLFTWKATDGLDVLITNSEFPTFVKLTHESLVNTIPVTFKVPIITLVTIGTNTSTWFYAAANTATNLYVANSLNTPNILTSIYSSPNILKFDNLKDLGIETISGLLPSYTDLNLASNLKFSSNPITFDTVFTGDDYSELRHIDLSDTSFKINSNANNFSLKLKPDVNPTLFLKISDLNLYNSCVTSISIPNSPLKNLDVRRSLISEFTLLLLPFLSLVSFDGCSKLGLIDVKKCTAYSNLTADTLTNVRSINISECHSLNTLICKDCTSLTSITIGDCPALKVVNITGCTASGLNIDLSGANNIETLIINNAKSLYITLSGLSKSTIKIIDFNDSLIGYIRWNSSDTNTTGIMDLFECTNLNEVHMANNTTVTEIQFRNPISIVDAVPLNYSFCGCTNLSRIYGTVKVKDSSYNNITGSFHNCTNFSILGYNTTVFNSTNIVDTTDNNRVKTPLQCITGFYDPLDFNGTITLSSFIQGSSNTRGVTNMLLDGTSFYQTFTNTKCTLFDIYYFFNILGFSNIANGSVTLTYTFNNISDKGQFNWSSTSNNMPHRYMFYNCSCIGTIYEIFMLTGNGNGLLLYSPQRDIDDSIKRDNGLFSPLNNMTSFTEYFSGGKHYVDPYILRRKEGNYALTNITYLYCQIIRKGLDSLTYTLSASVEAQNIADINNVGEFLDMFINLTNLQTILSSFNPSYAHYSNLILPISLLNIRNCFNASYATGNIELTTIFPTGSNILSLVNSFSVTNNNHILSNAKLPIRDDSFSNLHNLIYLGYLNIWSGGSNTGTWGFNGNGLYKFILLNTFPYDILKYCTNIVNFVGFFSNVLNDPEYYISSVEIPKTSDNTKSLFNTTTLLLDASGIFMDFGIPYTLVGEGFTTCRNLNKLNYTFASSSQIVGNRSKLVGSIPYKLFYHGSSVSTITKSGLVSDIQPDTSVLPETSSLSGIITVVSTISSMIGTFLGCVNITPYLNDNPDILAEPNSSWNPYNWIKSVDGTWLSTTLDTHTKDASWCMDGNTAPIDSLITKTEEDISEIEVLPKSFTIYNYGSVAGDKHYICPPDLLRYCTSTATINYLFSNCGLKYHSSGSYEIAADENMFSVGITGRICPYMFKPVSRTTEFISIFKDCKRLSSYSKGSKIYLIPDTLFNYIPNITTIRQAFQGMTFGYGTELAVFSKLSLSDIRLAFNCCLFGTDSISNKFIISSVFANQPISYASGVFSVYDATIFGDIITSPDTNTTTLKNQYINFVGDNFYKSKVINSTYVFYGYNSSTVTRVIETTIPDKNSNYA